MNEGYFFSVTQIKSIGSFPMFPDSCSSLMSIVGIHPTSPSGDGAGYACWGSRFDLAAHWPPLMWM